MLEGLMQHDYPLTLHHVLDRMRRLYADSEVVSVSDGERTRASYAQVVERSERLAGALADLGVEPGDRVATFAWNTRQHLEAYLAVPCMGAVLHTLKDQIMPLMTPSVSSVKPIPAAVVAMSLTVLKLGRR